VLLHGGLALHESTDQGVLLVGRSGVGKTTASRRLPPPWRSRSDDAALVVRDAGGGYWRTPGRHGASYCTTQRLKDAIWKKATPLKAIFILDQAAEDRVLPSGRGAAVCMLMEIARQATWRLWLGGDLAALHAAQTQRFDNLCTLVQAAPVYLLDVSLGGEFWIEMEKVL